MRVFTLILATMLFGYAAHLWLPWWIIAVVAMIISAAIGIRPWISFLTGFLAGFILWAMMALFMHQIGDKLLASRMAMLLGNTPVPALFGITGLLGGILSGLGALTGSLGRNILKTSSGR
jgi:hypothetical protein